MNNGNLFFYSHCMFIFMYVFYCHLCLIFTIIKQVSFTIVEFCFFFVVFMTLNEHLPVTTATCNTLSCIFGHQCYVIFSTSSLHKIHTHSTKHFSFKNKLFKTSRNSNKTKTTQSFSAVIMTELLAWARWQICCRIQLCFSELLIRNIANTEEVFQEIFQSVWRSAWTQRYVSHSLWKFHICNGTAAIYF